MKKQRQHCTAVIVFVGFVITGTVSVSRFKISNDTALTQFGWTFRFDKGSRIMILTRPYGARCSKESCI